MKFLNITKNYRKSGLRLAVFITAIAMGLTLIPVKAYAADQLHQCFSPY